MHSTYYVLVGTYLAWAIGALAVISYDRYWLSRIVEGGWSIPKWAALCLAVGGLALPYYYWASRRSVKSVAVGFLVGFVVAGVALVARIGLAYALEVPAF